MTATPVTVIRPMLLDDYGAVRRLLERTSGIQLRDADSFEGIARYLARNPGMSFVAWAGGSVTGCVFGGHDGRRGYLHHLAVAPEFRRRGIGRSLVAHALAAVSADGIEKFHIDVFAGNEEGLRFWQAAGWHERCELKRLSHILSARSNC
ncbi:MAG: GNAT family N-acetyltransferase [Rhodomicrobium sp.]